MDTCDTSAVQLPRPQSSEGANRPRLANLNAARRQRRRRRAPPATSNVVAGEAAFGDRAARRSMELAMRQVLTRRDAGANTSDPAAAVQSEIPTLPTEMLVHVIRWLTLSEQCACVHRIVRGVSRAFRDCCDEVLRRRMPTTTELPQEPYVFGRAAACAVHASRPLYYAAANGHVDLFASLTRAEKRFCTPALAHAAGAGHTAILVWARTNGATVNLAGVQTAAAGGGHLETLRYVQSTDALVGENRRPRVATAAAAIMNRTGATMSEHTEALEAAAAAGHVAVVSELVARGVWHTSHRAEMIAVENGHMDVLRALPDELPECLHVDRMNAAVRNGNVELLKFVYARTCVTRMSLARAIARYGSAEALVWVLDSDLHAGQLDASRLRIDAVAHGSVAVLECLRGRDIITFDRDLLTMFVSRASAAHVEWALKNGNYMLWSRLCVDAACLAKCDVLALLRDNDCPWTADVLLAALQTKSWATFAYAVENHCPTTTRVGFKAAQDISTLLMVHLAGYEWHAGIVESAAAHGRIACIQYATANGCQYDAQRVYEFAQDHEIRLWALAHGAVADAPGSSGEEAEDGEEAEAEEEEEGEDGEDEEEEDANED